MLKIQISLIIFFLGAVATYLWGNNEGWQLVLRNLLYIAPPLLATVFGIHASKLLGYNGAQGKVMVFMTIGIGLLFFGELLWVLYDAVLGIDPYPSLADFSYVLSYPFLFWGMVRQIQLSKVSLDSSKQIMIVIICVSIAVLGYLVGHDGSELSLATSGEDIFKRFYEIGDFILIICNILIFFVMLEYRKGKLEKPWLFIFAGIALIYIADILFSRFQLQYEDFTYPYNLIDLLWISGYLLIGYGFQVFGNIIGELQDKLKFMQDAKSTKD